MVDSPERWWQWNRARDSLLAGFCWTYLTTVLRGGRKHWETVVFWIAVAAVVLKQFFPGLFDSAALLAGWGEMIPFWVVCAYIVCRAALTPLWLYEDLQKKRGTKLSLPMETPEERYYREKSDSEVYERIRKFTDSHVNTGDGNEAKPYLVIDYGSKWRGYVSDQDPDGEEYFELQEFLKFRNTSDEVMRRIQVESFAIWGTEISTEIVPTLIHGEPAQKLVRGVEDQLKKANIGLRAFHKKPVGVPLIVTYYGQSDRQYLGRHALVYDKGNIRVEPLIDGAVVDWLDATKIVATQDEADD
jgi:hypothetical protein